MVYFKTKNILLMSVILVLAAKLLTLFGLGFISTWFFSPSRVQELGYLQAWNIWDSPHYLDLAQSGYTNSGELANFIVFFPAFPLAIWLVHLVTFTPYVLSSYIATFLAAVGAAWFLYKLVWLDEKARTALKTVLLLFIFPTAFFLHIGYTESLMLFFVTGCFYFVRQKRYLIGFIFALFAAITRITGLALIPALIIELYFYHKDLFKKPFPLPWLMAFIIPPLGFAAYLFLNFYLFGSFTYFLDVQRIHWGTQISLAFKGLVESWHNITFRPSDQALYMGWAQIAAFILGLAGLIYTSTKLRVSYALFYFFAFIVNILPSFWLSLPRYDLVLFPLFIMLAKLSQNKIFFTLWIIFSLVFYIIFSLIAVQHGPVF